MPSSQETWEAREKEYLIHEARILIEALHLEKGHDTVYLTLGDSHDD